MAEPVVRAQSRLVEVGIAQRRASMCWQNAVTLCLRSQHSVTHCLPIGFDDAMRLDTQLKTNVDRQEPADSLPQFVVSVYHWLEDSDDEILVGRVFGYLISRYDSQYTLYDRMDDHSSGLKETYEELFSRDQEEGEFTRRAREQLGDDADCWEQLVVMAKTVLHPSLADSKKTVLHYLVEQFGGTSLALIWGLHCTLFDHELSDLGYKPLTTSDDMWGSWAGRLSRFSQCHSEGIESPDVKLSFQDWVHENWPWKEDVWPNM